MQKDDSSSMAFQIQKFKDRFIEVATLPKHSSFGELALISNKPRAATIRAKTDWYLAVLSKEDYKKIYGLVQPK